MLYHIFWVARQYHVYPSATRRTQQAVFLVSCEPVLSLVLSLSQIERWIELEMERCRITVGSGSKEMERWIEYVQRCNIRKWAWHWMNSRYSTVPVHKLFENQWYSRVSVGGKLRHRYSRVPLHKLSNKMNKKNRSRISMNMDEFFYQFASRSV